MTTGPFIDAGLILGLVGMLLSGRVVPARAFALFALATILTGRIGFRAAFDALSSPAIWAVVSLVIFSLALGKLPVLRRAFFARRPQGLRATLTRLLASAWLASAVAPNTAVVAAMMGPASRRPNVSSHQLLLPLSYMALAAGMITPFGTSASLMVVGQAAAQGVSLSVIDFVLPGFITAAGVFIVLMLVAPWLLKESPGAGSESVEIFAVEANISEDSRLVGRTIAETHLRQLHSFYLAEIIRGGRLIAPVRPDQQMFSGDRLIFVGDINHMDELQAINGLTLHPDDEEYRHDNSYRAVVSGESVLVGRTLREVEFRSRFDASVLAVRRADQAVSGKLGEVRLQPGDLLLLAAGPDFHTRDNLRANLYLLDSDDSGLSKLSNRNAILLGLGFSGFLIAALFQLVPVALAALILVAAAILFDWVSPREARRNFPFDLVIVLWGAVLLSLLVRESGLSGFIADHVAGFSVGLSPFAALAAIFFMAWLMTEFFSNTSAALIALPVALDTASAVGADPTAFALAAAFGASASFFMPFGYQTHLMVLSPGRYSLADYLRLGAVVFVVYAVLSLGTLSYFAL
ncbi:SLC13 family permease [Hyphobacterium sp.]|uniref:SLC13 family permease n=1 Tax=Hyphobacterium sp. TaxID=2004662 RepID=UPI003749B921